MAITATIALSVWVLNMIILWASIVYSELMESKAA